jgi:hypothetical protein
MTNIPVTAVSGSPVDGPVKIVAPFLCSYNGVRYHPGDTADVSGIVARYWVDLGYATPTRKAKK